MNLLGVSPLRFLNNLSFLGVIPLPLSVSETVLRLLSVIVLIALNAFFVAAEFSIVSVRRSRINQLVSGGDVQAKTVQSLQQSIERLLSTTQLGITLSSLALGWIGEDTVAILLSFWLAQLPLTPEMTQFLSHSIALPLAFLLIAYLQIVLGELCPKSVALMYPEQIARIIGSTSLTISRLFTPFIWVLNQSTRFLLRLVGIRDQRRHYASLTPEELQLIISTSAETPGLDQGEREILNNIFEFRDVTVEEIMVPRTRVAALDEDATFQNLLDEMVDSKHSRYPVIGDSLDDIRGIIYFKELAKPLSNSQIQPHSPILPWIKPARFVPTSLPLNELLTRMQRLGHAMLIVVDDFGGTAGLVTLQDVTAEIIGDVYEVADEDRIIVLNTSTALVPAQTDIETVNEQLGLNLPITEDYQTLAGFVIFYLQKIPQVGEKLTYSDALEFTVTAAEGPRLNQIQIRGARLNPLVYGPSNHAATKPAGSENSAIPHLDS
ncbi:MAG: HlyC/CorC family transporter [Leptolyngbya sp. SIO4C1]|nr:HlyC/CorC family transporter [Leptolyngbya sp. SIO4C1]